MPFYRARFLPRMIFYLAVSLAKSDQRFTFPWALSCFVPSLAMLERDFNTTNLIFKLAFLGAVGCRVGGGFSLGPFWRPFAEKQAAFTSSQNRWDPTTTSAMCLAGPSCVVRPAGPSSASHVLWTAWPQGRGFARAAGEPTYTVVSALAPPGSY